MLPPVHPGVAYLIYAGGLRLLSRGPPQPLATVALVVGAVLPDLIDQSLYHGFGFHTTRTVGHSLVFAIPLCLVVLALVKRRTVSRATAVAFIIGYASHLLADAVWPILLNKPAELGYLLWPITYMPAYEGVKPLLVVGDVTITTLWIELPLLFVALVWWWRDGRPGLHEVSHLRER